MKKLIIKYIGVGAAVLVILAFAVYFAIGGLDGGSGKPVQKTGQQSSDDPAETADGESAYIVDGMPQIGDVIRTDDTLAEGDAVTWDVYSYADKDSDFGVGNCEVFVLHNASDTDLDLYADISYEYNSDEPQVNSICVNNVPSGGDVCVWASAGQYSSRKVAVSARQVQSDMLTIVDKLDIDYTDDGEGISGTVTNNSGHEAVFLDAVVLFMRGDEIIDIENIALYTEKESLAAGESQEFAASAGRKKYDGVRVFLTGYGKP